MEKSRERADFVLTFFPFSAHLQAAPKRRESNVARATALNSLFQLFAAMIVFVVSVEQTSPETVFQEKIYTFLLVESIKE